MLKMQEANGSDDESAFSSRDTQTSGAAGEAIAWHGKTACMDPFCTSSKAALCEIDYLCFKYTVIGIFYIGSFSSMSLGFVTHGPTINVHVTSEDNDMTTVVEDYVQMCFSPQEDPPLGQEVRTDTFTTTISLDDKCIG